MAQSCHTSCYDLIVIQHKAQIRFGQCRCAAQKPLLSSTLPSGPTGRTRAQFCARWQSAPEQPPSRAPPDLWKAPKMIGCASGARYAGNAPVTYTLDNLKDTAPMLPVDKLLRPMSATPCKMNSLTSSCFEVVLGNRRNFKQQKSRLTTTWTRVSPADRLHFRRAMSKASTARVLQHLAQGHLL